MTWIYENVTERLDLESRYNSLIHVQGETLDHLSEGVGVFGSDGMLRLHNPSFAAIWGLPRELLAKKPHVSEIVRECRRPGDDEAEWTRFTASVAGVDETRANVSGRMDRSDGRVIDYATVPLPDGQTMVTFVDVTDTVKVERALVDRNEALEAAASLKNAFIHHVSYELRSPLTNIIGFTQLLADPRIGPLTDRQREYVGYVMSSSTALLAIVNDILDLATIDAGVMELDLAEVDIAETIDGAIEGLQDRIKEARIRLEKHIPRDIGAFVADGKRIRQILFNLIANAISFSHEGGKIADQRPPRRRFHRVHGRGRGSRHPPRFPADRLRPLRQPHPRRGARRRRPRPLDREELRRPARRHRRDRSRRKATARASPAACRCVPASPPRRRSRVATCCEFDVREGPDGGRSAGRAPSFGGAVGGGPSQRLCNTPMSSW